jgi:hypothetical protein
VGVLADHRIQGSVEGSMAGEEVLIIFINVGYNGHPIPHWRVGGGPGISPALVVCYPYTIAGS